MPGTAPPAISPDPAPALAMAIRLGLIKGDARGRLRVDEPMSRYELAIAWDRLLGKLGLRMGLYEWDSVVTDVPQGHWARDSIGRLASVGLAQAVPFPDVDALHWAARAMPAARQAGMGSGDQHLLFGGAKDATIDDVVELSFRTVLAARGQGVRAWSLMRPTLSPSHLWAQVSQLTGCRLEQMGEQHMSRGRFALMAASFIQWWNQPPQPQAPGPMRGAGRRGGFGRPPGQ